MTNGDWIRQMTDDKLAMTLAEIADWTFEVDYSGDAEAWAEWLKKEVVTG